MIVGLGAAALAVGRRRARAPVVVGVLVGIGALLNLLHAVLPGDNTGLLRDLTPDAVGPLAHARSASSPRSRCSSPREGSCAGGTGPGRSAVAVAALSATLHALHGINQGTLASVVILTLLLARRHDFDGPGDVSTSRAWP